MVFSPKNSGEKFVHQTVLDGAFLPGTLADAESESLQALVLLSQSTAEQRQEFEVAACHELTHLSLARSLWLLGARQLSFFEKYEKPNCNDSSSRQRMMFNLLDYRFAKALPIGVFRGPELERMRSLYLTGKDVDPETSRYAWDGRIPDFRSGTARGLPLVLIPLTMEVPVIGALLSGFGIGLGAGAIQKSKIELQNAQTDKVRNEAIREDQRGKTTVILSIVSLVAGFLRIFNATPKAAPTPVQEAEAAAAKVLPFDSAARTTALPPPPVNPGEEIIDLAAVRAALKTSFPSVNQGKLTESPVGFPQGPKVSPVTGVETINNFSAQTIGTTVECNSPTAANMSTATGVATEEVMQSLPYRFEGAVALARPKPVEVLPIRPVSLPGELNDGPIQSVQNPLALVDRDGNHVSHASILNSLFEEGSKLFPSLFSTLSTIMSAGEGEGNGKNGTEKTSTKKDSESPTVLPIGTFVFNPSIDEEFFNRMGFGSGSDGIRKYQSQYGRYWKEHIENNGRIILEAVNMLPKKGTVEVLGTGRAFDIPLRALTEQFDKVIIVDVDHRALIDARKSLPKNLQNKVEIRRMDVTGVTFQYARAIDKIIGEEKDPQNALRRIAELTANFHLEGEVNFLKPGEHADLMISGMTVTQIGFFPAMYVTEAFRKKFSINLMREMEWLKAISKFAFQLHTDHIANLGNNADLVVLTSDIGEVDIRNSMGQIVVASQPRPLTRFAHDFREGLFANKYQILDERNWTWTQLVPPDSRTVGRAFPVMGYILKPLKESLPVDLSTIMSEEGVSAIERVHDATAADLEKQVEASFRKLIAKPGSEEFVFNRTTYQIGVGDINAVVNDALEASGSKMRIFVASANAYQSRVVGVVGILKSEEKNVFDGKMVRFISLDKPMFNIGIDSSNLAIDDQNSTVVTMEDDLREHLKSRQDSPRYSQHYQLSVHKRIYEEFLSRMGGVNEVNLDTLALLVLNHERGRLEAREKYGVEYNYLAHDLQSHGDSTITVLDQIYSDLTTLQFIVNRSRSDAESALRAFIIWSVIRNPQISGQPTTVAQEVISNLLLSAARVENGRVVVDWKKLESNLNSIRSVMDDIFAEITHHIRVDLLKETGRKARDLEDENTQYSQLRKEVASEFRKEDKKLSEKLSERLAAGRFVQFILDKKDLFGKPLRQTFLGDMGVYKRKIDDWMREKLGLNDATVPFKAPKVTVVKPSDIPPGRN